jgi:hypothetical protein
VSDYQPKPGDITVFKNTKKQPGDNRPDYDGKGLDVQGNPVRIALWIKEGRSGKFFSGQLTTPMEKTAGPAAAAAPASPPATSGGNDDLPF